MSESINYPSWQDVGVPVFFVDYLRRMGQGGTLDYLILNRVFRFNVRAQYVYECKNCGHTKSLHRHFEDYSTCEKCGEHKITSTAYWRMGKDKCEPYSQRDGLVSKIIQQMATDYGQYFRDVPPDDFVDCGWEWNKNGVEIPKTGPAFGKLSSDPEAEQVESNFGPKPSFAMKFCCGEKVVAPNQIVSVCRAAILCPFLWDDCFDWKYMVQRDHGRETHILPLLYMLAKMKGGDRNPSPMEAPSWCNALDYVFDEEPMPQPAVAIPDAIAEILHNDVAILKGILHD